MDSRLVYDVGGYDGSDTAHYLSLGYRVICIEAAPHLAEQISKRFHREIIEGQCNVLNVAIGTENGNATFYLSSLGFWNSFDRSMASRRGCRVTEISVPTRTFDSILVEYGVPYFLKIDIEGADNICLKALGGDLPQYVSFEAGRDSSELILMLSHLGYSRFSLISQDTFQPVVVPFPGTVSHFRWSARQVLRMTLRRYPRLHSTLTDGKALFYPIFKTATSQQVWSKGSSGPTPMEHKHGWHSVEEFMHLWTSVLYSGVIDSTWYDIHAVRN
jgi:FkbM family methyltransferase